MAAYHVVLQRRVRVLDARALGDPGFLGEAPLSLASLDLTPNSPPVNLWLPLKVGAAAIPHAVLCLSRPHPGCHDGLGLA